MFLILGFVVIALIAGFVANWFVCRQRGYETCEMFLAGIVGSFVGGTLFSLLAGDGFELRISGVLGSIVGATIVLLIYGPLRTTLRPSLRNKPATKNTALPEKRKNR